MLLQMVNIVKEQKPDVFLLCGDVYHTPQPSAAVQTMFTNALVEIHDANPDMTIIITAGNHDSGTKHDIFRIPWKALKVYTIGCIDANQKEDMIIEIPGKGYVIAVPYVNERNMPKGLFQELLDIIKKKNADNLPVVMSALLKGVILQVMKTDLNMLLVVLIHTNSMKWVLDMIILHLDIFIMDNLYIRANTMFDIAEHLFLFLSMRTTSIQCP